jgi:hypothetical protein
MAEAEAIDPTDDARAGQPRVRIADEPLGVLFELGVMARLNALPLESGRFERGAEAILFPTAVAGAIDVLYAVENELWRASGRLGEHLAYDRRELDRTLLRLIDLLQHARRHGLAVRIAL